jgi:uncharacterized protein
MNHLAGEASPYLRQHRDNPVEWHPWGDEAFADASRLDRPVLLSIGYSSCHWCHVMAHESFEDPATAAAMNAHFVNVKVDREERPDLDAVYMEAVQAMTGRGGWPMTVFLTPDGRPFFAGTYFPPRARAGMPAFVDVLDAVALAWRERREEVMDQAGTLTDAVADRVRPRSSSAGEPGPDSLLVAVEEASAVFDQRNSGFGGAPKFPQTPLLELLLTAHARTGGTRELEMAVSTLGAMARGGIYDHLGGGFSRYTVDAAWQVPHFEKMLYDQAGLLRAYLHAWQLTGSLELLQVVDETVSYVLRDLRLGAGGVSSAEDADSDGSEGRFYTWTGQELREVLGSDLADAATEWFGVTEEGNFDGRNVLHRPDGQTVLRPTEVDTARQLLYDARANRARPGRDDKALTEWNAMWCSALGEAAAATGNGDWLAAAVSNAEFLLSELRRSDGRWLRSWCHGPARHLAVAADYAWLVDAFTRLGEATGEARWSREAVGTAEALLDLFWDPVEGGLFTTGSDAEVLFARAKDVHDMSTPSANGVAAVALARLGMLTGEARYGEASGRILVLIGDQVSRHASSFAHALGAANLLGGLGTEVVVTGERPDLVDVAQRAFTPDAVLAWGEPYDSPLWRDRSDGLAYVCRGYACEAPAADPAKLRDQLRVAGPSP